MRAELPDTYAATRTDLHRLAVYVISPARAAVNGQITLRSTPGGFGTPPFGSTERQIRVEGTDLVVSQYRTETVQEPITTPAAGGRAGRRRRSRSSSRSVFDVPPHGDVDAPLQVDAAAAAALADWFASRVRRCLAEFRDECRTEDEPYAARAAVARALRRRRRRRHRRSRRHVRACRPATGSTRTRTSTRAAGATTRPTRSTARRSAARGCRTPMSSPRADPHAAALGFLREARRRRLGH